MNSAQLPERGRFPATLTTQPTEGAMERIHTFDDWSDLFKKWQKDIGFDNTLVKDYKFDAIYDEVTHAEIEFGEFAGPKKWDNVLQIPTQDMRDALLHLIVYRSEERRVGKECRS